MRFLVGLGNTGEKYINTRHNTGFKFLDFVKNVMGFEGYYNFEKKFLAEILKTEDLIFVKPQTFMNSSGLAVFKTLSYFEGKVNDLVVSYDDLDIEYGKWKVVKGVGPRVHNGVNSVTEQLKSEDFWHVRIGILGEEYKYIKSSCKSIADDYILKNFSKKEEEELYDIFGKVFDECREKKVF